MAYYVHCKTGKKPLDFANQLGLTIFRELDDFRACGAEDHVQGEGKSPPVAFSAVTAPQVALTSGTFQAASSS